MPERRFGTAYWSDPFVLKLPAKAKLLYVYLWTNLHCNQAGLYEIAPETISFETGIPLEELPDLMSSLEPKVAWYPEQNLVWVKNFLRHQTRSPQFLAAAAKCLESINGNGLVRDFLAYNEKHNLVIPYQYPIDREAVSDSDTLPLSYTRSGTSKRGSLFASFSLSELQAVLDEMPGGVDRIAQYEAIKQRLANLGTAKGYVVRSEYAVAGGRVDLCWLTQRGEVVAGFEIDYRTPRDKSLAKLRLLGCRHAYVLLRKDRIRFVPIEQISEGSEGIEARDITPPSESENVESLSAGDREVISVWKSVRGFTMKPSAMAELVAKLRTDFPDVDILAESKKWAARKLSEPLTQSSRSSGQIYNFMWKRHKWNQDQKGGAGGADGADGSHPRSSKPEGKWDPSKPLPKRPIDFEPSRSLR